MEAIAPIISKSLRGKDKNSYGYYTSFGTDDNDAEEKKRKWQYLSSCFLRRLLDSIQFRRSERLESILTEFLRWLSLTDSSPSDYANQRYLAGLGVLRIAISSLCYLTRTLIDADVCDKDVQVVLDTKETSSLARSLVYTIAHATGLSSTTALSVPSSSSSSPFPAYRFVEANIGTPTLLGLGDLCYREVFSSITDTILTLPNLRMVPELKGLVDSMNSNSGIGWDISLLLARIFECDKDDSVRMKIVCFFCNFCDCYFSNSKDLIMSGFRFWSTRQLLLSSAENPDERKPMEISWIRQLANCFSSLPLVNLIDSAVLHYDADSIQEEAVRTLKSGRGGGLKRLYALITLLRIKVKSTDNVTGKYQPHLVLDIITEKTVLAQLLFQSLSSKSDVSGEGGNNIAATRMAQDIISIISRALLCCPPVNNKTHIEQLAAVSLSTRSKILNNVTFFNPKLTCLLWEHLQEMNISDITMTSRSVSRSEFADDSIFLRTFFLFCSVLHHQLLATDDDELFGERGLESLSPHVSFSLFSNEMLRHIVRTLRNYLFQAYWRESYLLNTSDASLYQLQLLLSATLLFNHLCERNERRRYLSEDDWIWKSTSHSIAIIGENDTSIADESVEDEYEYLDGFRFSHPNSRSILTTIPQVIEFGKRVEIFEALISFDKGNVHGNTPLHQQVVKMNCLLLMFYG